MASSADLAGDVTVGVASSVDINEMASSADLDEVASSAELADMAASADLDEVAASADLAGYVTVGVTSLADPASAYTTRVALQEKCDVLSGLVCDYGDYFYDGQYDGSPDYLDYDDPDVYGFIEPDDYYELYHDLHGPDDCGVYCVARRDAGGTPYWTGVEDCDGYRGAVVLPQTGSGEPVSGVMPCWTDVEGYDVYESAVALR